jgi:hypothetical protein
MASKKGSAKLAEIEERNKGGEFQAWLDGFPRDAERILQPFVDAAIAKPMPAVMYHYTGHGGFHGIPKHLAQGSAKELPAHHVGQGRATALYGM